MLISASVRQFPNARPLDVCLVDPNGDQIGSIGSLIGQTATITAITPQNTTQVALAANPARKRFSLKNDTQRSALVAYAATASQSLHTFLVPSRSYQEFEGYAGIVSVIWEGNPNGSASVTEVV